MLNLLSSWIILCFVLPANAADVLGQFIEKKTLGKPVKSEKTKLKAYDDPLAQLLIGSGQVDMEDVELVAMSPAEKDKRRKEYEKTIEKLKKKGVPLFLNPELSETAAIYSKPGFDEEDCAPATDQCEIVSQATGPKLITSTGEMKMIESFDEFKQPIFDAYLKVKYKVQKNGKTIEKEGWVEADRFSTKEVAPLYPKVAEKKLIASGSGAKATPVQTKAFSKKEDCPPKTPAQSNVANLKDVIEAVQKPTLEFEKKVKSVTAMIGQCLMTKPGEDVKLGSQLVYDDVILPVVSKAAAGSKDPTQKQVIEIDAVSRTLYAEMARCYKKGLQYPMAVARIILNRKEYTDRKQNELFVRSKSDHDSLKMTAARVATEPSQFSAWLKKINGKVNPSLKHLMCPPSGQKEFYWKNAKVTDSEKSIWDQSVKIATEMTLYPEQFKKRTKSLANIHFYTSGSARIPGINKKLSASIEGRPLDLSSCINVFKDP